MPFSVWVTSGWNCTRVEAALRVLHRRDRDDVGVRPDPEPVRLPHDRVAVAHPHLLRRLHVGEQHAGRSTVSVVRPYSRWPVAATSPPSACAMSWCP